MGPWAPIPFHPDYEIDRDSGDIRNIRTHSYLYPESYTLILDGIETSIPELLALTFYGPAPLPVVWHEPLSARTISYKFRSIAKHNIGGLRFKDIPDFPRYWISCAGLVFDLYRQTFVPVAYNHSNYMTVSLVDFGGYRAPRKVHRLVYSAWVGPLDPTLTVDHKDDRRYNNYCGNLQQITAGENARKAFLADSNQHANVWTPEDIHTICKMLEQNYSYREIADAIGREYDVIRKDFNHLMHRLMTGKSYTNITQFYNFEDYCGAVNKRDRVLNVDKVKDIWCRVHHGCPIIDLAREYGCSTSTISKIRDGVTYKEITSRLDTSGSTTIESKTSEL